MYIVVNRCPRTQSIYICVFIFVNIIYNAYVNCEMRQQQMINHHMIGLANTVL